MQENRTCKEKHRSAGVASCFFSSSAAVASMKLSRPEKDTSMPLTTYGSSMNLLPCLANCSMLYPGLGSLLRPNTRANLSRQLPTAMSMVSPKMWYRRLE